MGVWIEGGAGGIDWRALAAVVLRGWMGEGGEVGMGVGWVWDGWVGGWEAVVDQLPGCGCDCDCDWTVVTVAVTVAVGRGLADS